MNQNPDEILRILPHRYPFLLVDRILEIEPGKRVVGQKCVSINEPFFDGHFPGRAIMPGALILEALAQVGAVLHLSRADSQGQMPYLTAVQHAHFRHPVAPGDVLALSVTLSRLHGNSGWAKGEARVEGKLVCDMRFSFSVAKER